MYQCEFCNFQTTDETECLSHEARKHYGITLKEYEQWKKLNEEASRAGAMQSISCNPHTRAEFDRTIRELVDFEKAHGLPDTTPRHFR